MKQLRIAILGCGGFARHHAQLLASMPEQAQLVACCDRNLDLALAATRSAETGIPVSLA